MGIPLIICIILFLPWYKHLALNMLVVIFSGLGAVEFSHILKQKNLVLHPAEAMILGSLCPLAMTASVSFGLEGALVPAALVAGVSWLLLSRVFGGEGVLKDYTNRAAAGISVMVYPGFFLIWIIRMADLPRGAPLILTFLLTVMFNDSIAWAAGVLFGKGNRGIIPASPNKSIAGFAGGAGAAVIAGTGCVLLFPAAFTPKLLSALPSGIVLGFLSGIAAALGDLGESALKRSSAIKDSGSLIPGRGGVLDSIDSIALAAPVFYAVYRLLFR
jgi:phosphatidate cytidylyltransferase